MKRTSFSGRRVASVLGRTVPFLGLAVFLLSWSWQSSSDVEEKAELFQVRPFPLRQVQLLEGSRFYQALELNKQVLLRYEPDRFLARFRSEAGLEPKAEAYGGWEADTLAGHSLGHYLSGLSLTYAVTEDPRFKARIDYIVDELAAVQAANGNGYIGAFPGGRQMFEQVSQGHIESQPFRLNGIWSPLYTVHKIFAGLRDAYRLADNRKALEVEAKFGDWALRVFSPLSDEQMQKVLDCEYGGMNEVLADLALDTGNPKYLELARRFHHRKVLDPLIAGKDVLPGLHGNTQVPKLIGLARIYELTGDASQRRGAEFFWYRVVYHHSYVTGGHGLGEYFGEPDQLNDRLGMDTTESCNVYNMLKLTKHLIAWEPRAEWADFYERALYNHILATQHPESGRVIYNLCLDMGGHKVYQDPFGFTCCVGTGMENHSKYGESVYFHGERELYVNLFIPTVLAWPEKGLRLTQETDYPDGGRVVLTFALEQPLDLKLLVRYPGWCSGPVELLMNGQRHPVTSVPGSYISLERRWRDGDRVELRFPLNVRLESMPDNPRRVAILYGPLVLAGDLGPVDDPRAFDPDYVPVFAAWGRPVEEWVRPVANQQTTFQTSGVGRPRDLVLVPFFRMHDRRYSVYWDLITEAEWADVQRSYAEQREKAQSIEARTVDRIVIGERESEQEHNFEGENTHVGHGSRGRRYRSTSSRFQDGFFSYRLKVEPGLPQALAVQYWGSDGKNCRHEILVDGTVVAEKELTGEKPSQYFWVEYPLPDTVLEGKSEVTVTFRSHDPYRTGGIYDVRIVRR